MNVESYVLIPSQTGKRSNILRLTRGGMTTRS